MNFKFYWNFKLSILVYSFVTHIICDRNFKKYDKEKQLLHSISLLHSGIREMCFHTLQLNPTSLYWYWSVFLSWSVYQGHKAQSLYFYLVTAFQELRNLFHIWWQCHRIRFSAQCQKIFPFVKMVLILDLRSTLPSSSLLCHIERLSIQNQGFAAVQPMFFCY